MDQAIPLVQTTGTMSYDQSYNESFPLTATATEEEVPLLVTFLNMVVIIMVTIVVIIPALMVLNVIWWTRELHTKYYFFVANLLVTNMASIIVESILQYAIMIIYLLNASSNSAAVVLKWTILFLRTVFHLMIVMLPITVAAERLIVIGFPYRHRSIMTTKRAGSMLAAMWGLSTVLAGIITAIVPVDIVWPLALVDWGPTYLPFILIPRLTSAVFIVVANAFLHHEVTVSNRKAKENERLGNEEEAKKFKKLGQLFKAQSKATITLLLVGGIDVIANMLIPLTYVVISITVEPSMKVYIEQFFLYPLKSALLLSHPLVYGLYMKKIRRRLPSCTAHCQCPWTIRQSRVITLHQQPPITST